MKLRDAAPAVLEALHRLLQLPEVVKPHVVVESTGASGTPFVQFAGSDERELVLDVPLTAQWLRASYRDQRLVMTSWGVEMRGLGREEAADRAVHILKYGFGMDDEDEVVVVEGCGTRKGEA